MLYTFFMAMAAGFGVAAPIGPVSVVCARFTHFRGPKAGFVGGLGAATGDAVFGGLAGLAVTGAALFLKQHAAALSVLGGLGLAVLGVATLRSRLPLLDRPAEGAVENYRGVFLAAFVLTIANPLTFLAFLGLFAWVGVNATDDGLVAAALLVAGVFLGALLWWSLLAHAVSRYRQSLESAGMRRINQVSGVAIIVFGAVVVLRAGWMLCRG